MRLVKYLLFLVLFLAISNANGQQVVIGVSPEGKCVASTPGKIHIVGLNTTIFFPTCYDIQLEENNGVLLFHPSGSKNLKSVKYGSTFILLKTAEDKIGLLLEVEVIRK